MSTQADIKIDLYFLFFIFQDIIKHRGWTFFVHP